MKALQRLLRTGFWLKVIAWAIFLPGFGAVCLHHRLLGPAALLGLLGLLLGARLLWVVRDRRRRLPVLALCAVQLLLLVASLWLLARPLQGGWVRLHGTEAWSDPTLLLTGDGVLVVVTSSPKASFWSEDGGQSFRPRGLPGHFGFVLADDDQRGWVWVGPGRGSHLNMFNRGTARWLQLARPAGHVWALALSEDRVFMALGVGGLRTISDENKTWRVVAGIEYCSGVATAPDAPEHLLAVGRPWSVSDDGGLSWRPLRSPLEGRFNHPEVALGGGGWSYVYEGGLVSGELAVAAPGKSFERRPLPASDVRVLVADAEEGGRAWAGSWGRGVFGTRDGGQRWEDLGLQSIEVRSLVLDPRHRRLFAASSNLLLRRGVYSRTLPP